MATPAQVQPAGQSITRTTRGIPGDPRNPSRKLTYFINVIQQPERARACGSGAKSSADRRPVDPPPVVQLRIMEGENAENDITFAYDANFFLFATLESVRQIAHGRVHPAPSQIPVLTGMPVSGMAYLDRPHEAGYFIFPDLSVRHEGYYNLSFNLYEQTKEAKDMDAEPSKSPGPAMPENELPAHSFHWRLTVKSQPFTVFSAKKFPGLAESTTLSRTVAEQGCRVRIRRDVRMRRRDKAEEEFNGSQAHDMYARPNRHIEQPQEPYSRERSNSLTGDDARRMSSGYHEQLDAYRSPSGSPSPPLQELAGQEKMSWLKPNNASGPQFVPPPAPHQPQQQQPYQGQPSYHAAPPPPPPQQHPHPPVQHHIPAQHQYRGPPPPAPSPAQPYAQERPYPSSSYPPPHREQSQTYDDPHRRHSAAYPPTQPSAPPPPSVFHPAVDSNHQHRPSFQGYNHPPSPSLHPVLPPLKAPLMNQYSEELRSPSGPLPPVRTTAPSFTSPNYIRPSEPPSYPHYPRSQPPPLSEPTRVKRPHDTAFSYPSQAPLRDGARPDNHEKEEEEEDDEEQRPQLAYRRATGLMAVRQQPEVINS